MTGGGDCPFARTAESVLAICRRTFQRPRPDGSLPRQFHDKTHACLEATFTAEPPAEPALRHGLFAADARYRALVRFSSSFFADDRIPDARGMAIKVLGVSGDVCDGAPPGQQDFVLVDQPIPPARDLTGARCLFEALDGADMSHPRALVLPGYVRPGRDPRNVRWFYLRLMASIVRQRLLGRGLSRLSYYGVTPYRLGSTAVKYRCVPEGAGPMVPRRGDLRERLQAALDGGPVRFALMVQPRLSDDEPIEDAVKRWRGPLVRVGTLEIPPQDAAATIALGDRLAFAPWNCLRAHEPLGAVNALRRLAYRASAENRGASAAFEDAARAG